MSNKVISKCLLAKNTCVSQYNLFANCNMTFGGYEQELNNNLRKVMQKYSHLNEQKVRDLLQELDNNCELAMQILDEEHQNCSKIVQEKKKEEKKAMTLTLQEENRFLKKAYLNLYKKLLLKSQQLQEIQAKYQSQTHQNKKLKQLNRILLHREYSNASIQDNTPIC